MKQIFHHYTLWEDYKNGMWNRVPEYEAEVCLKKAIEFTGNDELYGNAMLRVINEWPITCEHNLTDMAINRRAFIGHAACSIELNIPEYIVRAAWHNLTDEQRTLANARADYAIQLWEKQQLQKQTNEQQTILEL